MISLEVQLKKTVTILISEGIKYALAGAMAASVYRDDERTTKDVDFIISGQGNLSARGKDIIVKLGLSAHVAKEADLDGGPLFARKRGTSAEMIIIGRDPEKKAPGVDFLLPANPWVPKALERAQLNAIDWGFSRLPTLTVEDVVVAKLISSHNPHREQDILDLRSIFRAANVIDLVYVISRMKEFAVTVPKSIERDIPFQLVRAGKRIARAKRRKSN